MKADKNFRMKKPTKMMLAGMWDNPQRRTISRMFVEAQIIASRSQKRGLPRDGARDDSNSD